MLSAKQFKLKSNYNFVGSFQFFQEIFEKILKDNLHFQLIGEYMSSVGFSGNNLPVWRKRDSVSNRMWSIVQRDLDILFLKRKLKRRFDVVEEFKNFHPLHKRLCTDNLLCCRRYRFRHEDTTTLHHQQ